MIPDNGHLHWLTNCLFLHSISKHILCLLAITLNISVAHSPLDTISIKFLQKTKLKNKLLFNQSKNIAKRA